MKCQFDLMPSTLMFSGQFYEKWVSVRKRTIKLRLETDTYIAITETVTCIITITIFCTAENTTCVIATPTCIISKKIVTHIFAAEISNCVIATETVTCIIATKRSTNIFVTKSTTNIIAIRLQNLHNCNRRWHLRNCYWKCQLHSSNRNYHLQNWLQKLSLAEMVPVRDPFGYNKEIYWTSKDQV